MYAVSPHWDREKAIFLNDLLQMRMIKEMFPEKEILTTLFDTYNITRFSRYGVNVLSHLFENKDAPT
ncbi:MAG: hypothetical protein LBU27_05870 [Candidatus Peribacteria bacterium]|jgi:hypothetical protein|nr:hypothetical protein [Candidatus Peribacteria bacterium]